MSFYTLGGLPYDPDVPTDGSDWQYVAFKIAESNTKHVMSFPAFIESIKYNTSKDMEVQSEADKWSKVVIEYTGDLTIDVRLNLPASSPQQAKTNLAKIENLQKLLLNPYYEALSDRQDPIGPLFKVSFANLIHGGKQVLEGNPTYDIFSNGFPCIIESINYTPDMEMGFFEYEGEGKKYEFLYPKLINLDLQLKIENKNEKLEPLPIDFYNNEGSANYIEYNKKTNEIINPDAGIVAFLHTSNYRDNEHFPFGIWTDYNSWKESYKICKRMANNREYYISISRNERVAIFPAFIEDFKRNYTVKQNYIESKSGYVGKGIDTGKYATPETLSYDLSFSVPCASIEESKIFCDQVQVLMRIFYRAREMEGSGDPGCYVYVPGFIESGNGPEKFQSAQGNSTGYLSNLTLQEYEGSTLKGINSALLLESKGALGGMWMQDLSVDIESDMGFFEEGDCFYPKAFKVSIKFVSDMRFGNPSGGTLRGNVIFPHKISYTNDGLKTTNLKETFPFNRKNSQKFKF